MCCFFFLYKDSKAYFLIVVAIAKEVVSKAQRKGTVMGISISSLGSVRFLSFYLKRTIRVKKDCLSPDVYKKIWIDVARIVKVNISS